MVLPMGSSNPSHVTPGSGFFSFPPSNTNPLSISPNPSPLSLSRCVLSRRFGGLPGHAICKWGTLNYVDLHATVEERLMSRASSLGENKERAKTAPFSVEGKK